jgi:hypothetical protein
MHSSVARCPARRLRMGVVDLQLGIVVALISAQLWVVALISATSTTTAETVHADDYYAELADAVTASREARDVCRQTLARVTEIPLRAREASWAECAQECAAFLAVGAAIGSWLTNWLKKATAPLVSAPRGDRASGRRT